MKKKIIKNGKIVNQGIIFESDILINDDIIEKIAPDISDESAIIYDAAGKIVIPGIIDDQVHFRDPGLTHKADIFTESRAAVAGGVTSFMDMPNTIPNAVTIDELEKKYNIASEKSVANYSFYLGTSNNNLEEIKKINPRKICGLKIFLGGSTGNMLVDDYNYIEKVLSNSPVITAVHSEDNDMLLENLERYKNKYGEDIPIDAHSDIRNVDLCYKSTERIIEYARKTNARLHVLHLTTAEELDLFDNNIPLKEKKITAEVCAHHLHFDRKDYEDLGAQIKCNPAIKEERHRISLLNGLLENRIDVVATDHAPHTWDEKQNKYLKAPSGIPLVQHSLNIMLDLYRKGRISLTQIVDKMSHSPSTLFRINNRGFLKEGYFADIAIVDLNTKWRVNKSNILYKCKWSPFEGVVFKGLVTDTFVNGNHVFQNGEILNNYSGKRLEFDI
jgi:dihydroorotase